MSRINFLEETIERLKDADKTPADVRWCQLNGAWFTWDEFVSAATFEYDNGYGGNEIPLGLKIVGEDWWLERGEYDGSEWWEFKTMPTKPDIHDVPPTLIDAEYWKPLPETDKGVKPE